MGALLVRLAPLIRLTIQTITQVGLIGLADKLLGPLVDYAKREVQQVYGVSDEEAGDFIANELIDAVALAGVIGFGIKTKLPTLLAEKLGFTAKGYVKRKLSSKIPTAAVGTVTKAEVASTVGTEVIAKQAAVIAAKRGVSLATVQAIMSTIIAAVGVPVGVGLLITNTIDFGAWNSSAYQGTFQKFLSIFGLEPDKDSRAPRTTSADIFNKIYNALLSEGASTINDPYKGTIVPYTRDNLLDLADKLASQILIEVGEVKSKTLLAAILPFIAYGNKPASGGTSVPIKTGGSTSTTTKVQVFSGVVSQGTLGNGVVFSPRTNDMIDDVEELIQSASINLATFLSTLASRVIYEIKIVSTITTKDGFTQRGTVHQVQVGTFSNGAPRYKTVTNKFAVLYLYLMTDKGTKTKIATVNVGPVNAINFQVQSNDLVEIANRLRGVVTTSNVSEIKQIVSDTPIAVTPVPATPAPLPNYNISAKVPGDLGYAFYKRPKIDANPVSYVVVPDYRFGNPEYQRITEEEYRRETGDKKDYTNSGYQLVNGVFTKMTDYQPSDLNPPATPAQVAKANLPHAGSMEATSIAFFYDPNGKNYPSVAERAVLYEQYGLGSKDLYIGSAEQNIKLLAKLKGF